MNFLSFSGDYWDGPRHNRHYFLEELGRRDRVLFVSPPFYIVNLIRQMGKGTLHPSGVREISSGLVNYAPSKMLFTNLRVKWLNDAMASMRHARVQALVRKYKVEDPILFLWHPMFRDQIGRFNERLVIYYAYDQYTGYTGGDAKASPAEVELMERADLVFVLSRELLADKRKAVTNPDKVVHLANAVDYPMFAAARDDATQVPDDIASIPHPRIGYIGTINEKVNLPALEAVADADPSWQVVLIGRENYSVKAEKQRFEALVARPNVHWLGHRSHTLVPAYIKGLDVLTMCYVINNWTFYGDPSKLHEYLASGKPTIGTGLPAIREFSDVVAIPETPEEWPAAVAAAIADRDEDLVRRRIETAQQNSYAARIDRFLEIVSDTLARKGR